MEGGRGREEIAIQISKESASGGQGLGQKQKPVAGWPEGVRRHQFLVLEDLQVKPRALWLEQQGSLGSVTPSSGSASRRPQVLASSLHSQVAGPWERHHRSSVTRGGFRSQSWLSSQVTRQRPCPHSSSDRAASLTRCWQQEKAHPAGWVGRAGCSHTTQGTVTQVAGAGALSRNAPTLVLPFVVEYDPDDNGKDGKHQGEKDDEKEGQAAEGRQRGAVTEEAIEKQIRRRGTLGREGPRAVPASGSRSSGIPFPHAQNLNLSSPELLIGNVTSERAGASAPGAPEKNRGKSGPTAGLHAPEPPAASTPGRSWGPLLTSVLTLRQLHVVH